MSHAERCPVCYGSGKYTPPANPNSSAVPQPQICHGCGGKGWVELNDYTTPNPWVSPPYVPPYTSPNAPGTTSPQTNPPYTWWLMTNNNWK